MTYTIVNPEMLFWAVVLWTKTVAVLSYWTGYTLGKRAHLPISGRASGAGGTEAGE